MVEQTERIYERAGFGGSIAWGRAAALLVVDFSCGFTDPDSPLGSDMTAEVSNTRRVLDVARESGTLVVFTSIAYDESLRDGGAWMRKVPSLGRLTAGSRWVELDPELARQPEEPIVYKRAVSAFFGTHLALFSWRTTSTWSLLLVRPPRGACAPPSWMPCSTGLRHW